MMTPINVDQVEALLLKRLTWKLGAVGLETCKRIVKEAIDALPNQYPYLSQLDIYLKEKTRLERMLAALGGD